MTQVATIGLDIAKDVFQVYGADEHGAPLFNRRLGRAEVLPFFEKLRPSKVGIEACSTAHHWSREISRLGHDVRLIHAAYVRPFVKRGKTDANDAEAINEALTRKTMRFVSTKTIDQQATAMAFSARSLFVKQKTQSIGALRGHLAELGIISSPGAANVASLSDIVRDESGDRLPASARAALLPLVEQIELLSARIDHLERELRVASKGDEVARRLMTIPGVGPNVAMAIRSLVPDPGAFRSARHFAAWIGLTPRSYSSGSKIVLGRISKMGNKQLRSLLVMGAMSVFRWVKTGNELNSWVGRLRNRRPLRVAAVALANKNARIIWALLVKGGAYKEWAGDGEIPLVASPNG